MKKKLPFDQEIYLPEYLSGTASRSFEKEVDQRILYWDFSKALDEKIKMQIELLLNEIVKSIKNREERRNRYLLPLKCLFCYAEKSGLKDIMKMEKAQEQEYSLMLRRVIVSIVFRKIRTQPFSSRQSAGYDIRQQILF